MRAAFIVTIGLFCGLALSQYLLAQTVVSPVGDVLTDHSVCLHEHAVANMCEAKVAESEEEIAAICDLELQFEFSAPLAAAERGSRLHSSPRELLHTLHRLQI